MEDSRVDLVGRKTTCGEVTVADKLHDDLNNYASAR
jgi:hypothetical protein